ncbi:helix-hairpin-helix domain-containing protein [Pseudarthrobacter sp. P1]|uniref:helix-hairpin-helix domain-containing protein n=1 Tax=Pseudarthrobacter sp. P1 TaxID=3418418 RepID=UPI003CFAE68B
MAALLGLDPDHGLDHGQGLDQRLAWDGGGTGGGGPAAGPVADGPDTVLGLPEIRWRITLRAVVLVLAVLASITAVLWFQQAQVQFDSGAVDTGPAPVGVPPPGTSGAALPGTDSAAAAGATGSMAAPESGGAADARILVHVAGAVARPGIVQLAPGSRVYQAIDAAGGMLPDAAPDALNLAAAVDDGARILVPTQAQASSGVPVPAAGAVVPGGAKINLNTATAEQLAQLPRVGPVLAQRIVDWRTEHGKFNSIQELDAVSGIGAKMLEALLPLVTV